MSPKCAKADRKKAAPFLDLIGRNYRGTQEFGSNKGHSTLRHIVHMACRWRHVND